MDSSQDFHSIAAPALVPRRLQRARAGLAFLNRQRVGSGCFPSFISTQLDFSDGTLAPSEIFSSALILICLAESELQLNSHSRLLDKLSSSFTPDGFVHFFEDRALLPADVDCTMVVLDALFKNGHGATPRMHRALTRIAANTDANGVLRVYLDADPLRTKRVDAVVCVNALYTFSTLGRERELLPSVTYVAEHLASERFEAGTRYYPSPDLFLYFASRLVRDFGWAEQRFGALLRERLQQRSGNQPTGVLELAARATAASNLGLVAAEELRTLADAQGEDGSWRASPCFRFGRSNRYFGGECLSTGLALRALMADNIAQSTVPLRRFGTTG